MHYVLFIQYMLYYVIIVNDDIYNNDGTRYVNVNKLLFIVLSINITID